jgi:hypothetical protein
MSEIGWLVSFVMSFMVLFVVLLVILYLFSALYLYKIANKYEKCDFPVFLVPFYRVYLVAERARVPWWIVLGYYAPTLLLCLACFSGLRTAEMLQLLFGGLVWIIRFCCRFYLWGRVAQSMRLSFGLWGFFSALMPGISVCEVLLAFDPALRPGGAPAEASGIFPAEASLSSRPGAAGFPAVAASYPGSAPRPALLYGHTGPFAGQSLPIPPEGLRMGREPQGNDLVLPLTGISRHHARILPGGDGWILEDLGSTNGTFILSGSDWTRIQGAIPLGEGARFRLGNNEIELELR